MNGRGMFRCSLAAVLFGISAPAASRLADDLGAFSLAGLLYLGAALFVLPVVGRARPTRPAIAAGGPRLAVAVVLGGAVGPALLAAGLSRTPPATASLLLNLELVFTTVLAAFVFREYIGRRVVAGTALVTVAGGVLGWSGSAELRWGALLIAGACLCWGVDNCVTATLDELTPAQITFAKGVIAGSANLALGVALDGAPAGAPVLTALAVGGFGYGISITLWVAGARDLGAARAQLVFATAPFVGAAVAWTAFGEPVLGREVLALAIAAVGVSRVFGSGHQHGHRHDAAVHDHEHRHDDGHHDGPLHGDVEPGDDHHRPGVPIDPALRHRHRHRHVAVRHVHPHVPDVHHRHVHAPDGD